MIIIYQRDVKLNEIKINFYEIYNHKKKYVKQFTLYKRSFLGGGLKVK